MLVTIFLHCDENRGISREVCTSKDIMDFLIIYGWERIERVVITDFRPLIQLDHEGNRIELAPDL